MKRNADIVIEKKPNNGLIVDTKKYSQLTTGIFVTMFENAGFVLDKENSIYNVSIPEIKENGLYLLPKRLKDKGYTLLDNAGILSEVDKSIRNKEEDKKLIDVGRQIKNNPTLTRLEIPNFKRELKDFQERVVKHTIAVRNGANFSCPGSGKTTMIYATYAHWKYTEKCVEKILVICPISAFETWESEYKACFGKWPNVARLNGSKRHMAYKNAEEIELFTINHSTLSNDVNKIITLLKKYPFMVVLDESHYVKNFSEKAIWANAVIKIAKYAQVRIISSGTPAPNGEEDFWSQFTFLLGGEHIFGNRIRYAEELKNDRSKKKMMNTVNALSHRVTKVDLNLPPISIKTIKVRMEPIQKRLYKLMANEINEEVLTMNNEDANVYMAWRKAKLIRLRQLSSNPALLQDSISDYSGSTEMQLAKSVYNYYEYEMSSKMKKTIELARQFVQEGKRVLLWSEFVGNIKKLTEIFNQYGMKVFSVYGDIPKEATDEVGDELTREGQLAGFKETKGSILVANPQTLAEAVSLHQECHIAVYMDRSFNCAHWMQSKDRIHRVGLDEDIITEYYIIENEECIDEVIDIRLNEKEERMNRILHSKTPYAICEFNGKDFQEDQDFQAVLAHIRDITKVGL